MSSAFKLDRLQAYLHRLGDRATGDDFWLDERGAICAAFQGIVLTSAFQTVHRLADGLAVGAQALVRDGADHSGLAASPWLAFAQRLPAEQLVALDRRSRTVHTLNYFRDASAPEALFLCVHDRLVTAVADHHGRAFRRVLETLGLPHARVVIDLPAETGADATLMANAVANYRLHGFRVSASLEQGLQLAAVNAVAALDFVKIDAADLARFDGGDGVGRRAVELARSRGARLIVKRLETAAHLAQAESWQADLAQGWFFERPLSAGEWLRRPAAEPVGLSPRRGLDSVPA